MPSRRKGYAMPLTHRRPITSTQPESWKIIFVRLKDLETPRCIYIKFFETLNNFGKMFRILTTVNPQKNLGRFMKGRQNIVSLLDRR